MKFTNEQLEKAKLAKSAEELLALAKESGIELTGEEAAKYYAELHREGEIADDELDNVAGGCGDDYEPDIPSKANITSGDARCPVCGTKLVLYQDQYGVPVLGDDAGQYDPYICPSCKIRYRHHWYGDLWTND